MSDDVGGIMLYQQPLLSLIKFLWDCRHRPFVNVIRMCKEVAGREDVVEKVRAAAGT